MYEYFNPNPYGKNVDDCVIRAIAKIMDISWDEAYMELTIQGIKQGDLQNSNSVWNAYLKGQGFLRYTIPNTCPDCYSVKDFCEEHPEGEYVLGTGSHAVAVEFGRYYDAFDSGNEVPIYYFERQ